MGARGVASPVKSDPAYRTSHRSHSFLSARHLIFILMVAYLVRECPYCKPLLACLSQFRGRVDLHSIMTLHSTIAALIVAQEENSSHSAWNSSEMGSVPLSRMGKNVMISLSELQYGVMRISQYSLAAKLTHSEKHIPRIELTDVETNVRSISIHSGSTARIC
jgi:hypothetical protein